MIIREVKHKKPFFGKAELIVVTNEGEGSVPLELSKHYSFKEINKALYMTEMKKVEGLNLIKEKLGRNDERMIRAIQLASFNSQEGAWKSFTEVKQVPRPMSLLLKKEDGTEFLVFSLDAAGFEKASLANQQLKEEVKRRIKDPDKKSNKEILEGIVEAVKKINLSFDLELKLGVNFAGKEEKEKVAELIDEFKLTYVENPTKGEKLEDYAELSNKFRTSCFICAPFKNLDETELNNYNAVMLQFCDIHELVHLIDILEEKKMNIFYKLRAGEEELAVALKVPIIKIVEEEKVITERLTKVKDKIRKHSLKQKPI